VVELLLTALAAFAAGAVLAWLVRDAQHRAMRASLEAQLAAAREQGEMRAAELARARGEHAGCPEALARERERRAAAEAAADRVPHLDLELTQQRSEAARLQARVAELETALSHQQRSADEKLALIDDARQKLSDAFNALSAEALKSNNQAFIDLATATLAKFQEGAKSDLEARQKAVDELVRPLRESLQKVDGALGDIEKARLSAYSALSEQLKGLVETHLPMLRSETANLVKALRQPSVRGRWGEIQLRRVVEMAGMLEHCDFVEQESRTTSEGRLRPDLIVRLPGGKSIVVDAKAPVAAYLNAAESCDEATQQAALADHARQVRDHVVALARKGYWEQFDPTPEFVVLFLPGEMFFSAALQQDPALIEFAAEQHVIPATPTTLISLLKAVAYGWRQEALAQNAREVAELGKQLYERIASLAQHWGEVGQRLDRAVESYNRSVATLETRVLVSARRLRELKAAPGHAEIPTPEPVERSTRALQAIELVPQVAAERKG
jgi:DNA recombination protein RmuC